MRLRPGKLSRSPARLDLADPRGDVLADVLGVVLLRNVLYRRVEGRAPWGLRLPPRDKAVFYLIAQGAALLEVEGERAVWLAAGDVAIVPHGTAHTLRDSPKSKAELICQGSPRLDGGLRRLGGSGALTSLIKGVFDIGGAQAPTLLAGLPRVVTLCASDGRASPRIAATVELLLAESAEPGPASTLVLQRLADVLVVQVLRTIADHSDYQERGLRALSDPPVHTALELMHTRVAAPWTVANLAREVGLSRSAFAARFGDLVGEPPLQYLTRWRMARAAEFLRESKDAVGAISLRVGYESVPSFIKAFKRWQGVSPGAFRRERSATASAQSFGK